VGDAKILVVDDTPDSRTLIVELLKVAGYEVKAAASGQTALDLVAESPPDLIVLDLQMPGMDGFTTLANLREIAGHIPVLALSAHVLPDDERLMLAAGFDGSLSKPVSLKQLHSAVSGLLEGRERKE